MLKKRYQIINADMKDVGQIPDRVGLTVDGTSCSDGYHTFDELYDHRIALFIALCQDLAGNNHPNIWKSKKHHDGSEYEGWFIMGINEEKGEQITYHLPMSEWDNTHFAQIYEFAPEWDGHTSADVIKRIKNL